MEKEDKKRLEDLKGEQIHLQSQCYLMKKGLEANEIRLGKVVALIAEYEAEDDTPRPPQAGTPLDRGEGQPQGKEEKPDA